MDALHRRMQGGIFVLVLDLHAARRRLDEDLHHLHLGAISPLELKVQGNVAFSVLDFAALRVRIGELRNELV